MSGPLAATFPCATASAGSSGWASVELNWGSCPAWLFAYAHNGSCGSWSAADGCSTYGMYDFVRWVLSMLLFACRFVSILALPWWHG